MSYAAFAVAGTKLQVEISSVYTDIPGVSGFDGPGGDKPEIDVTAISDTARQKVGGIIDYGSANVTMFWDPANDVHQYLKTRADANNVTDDWKIVCSDAGTAAIAFTGFVKGWKWNFQNDQAVSVQFSIVLSGAATVTP